MSRTSRLPWPVDPLARQLRRLAGIPGGFVDQVNFLLGEIDLLKKKNKISGASMVAHWSLRRIQPLQQ